MHLTSVVLCFAAACSAIALPFSELYNEPDDLKDKDGKPEIQAMFNIVKEVVDQTVVDFEQKAPEVLKNGEVGNFAAGVMKEMGLKVTSDGIRAQMLGSFMGMLNAELKEVVPLVHQAMVRDKRLAKLVVLLKKYAKKNDNDEEDEGDELDENDKHGKIREAILKELGKAGEHLRIGLSKRFELGMNQLDEKYGKRVNGLKRGLVQFLRKGVKKGARAFGYLFGRNFGKDEKANELIRNIMRIPPTQFGDEIDA